MTANFFIALLRFLIFPGLLFTAVVGLVMSWLDRKVTARVQWRVGPPFLQPFYDIVKLLGKEVIVPAGGSRMAFLGAPLVGLAGATLAATLIGTAAIYGGGGGFRGDIIILLYLLVLPSLAVILGGAASKNPLASVGASREMKLLMGYELPFILVMLVPIIQSGGMLSLGNLLSFQAQHGSFAASLSGVVALVAVLPCLQAKLALVPFDQAEAETEIMGGALIEYSGAPLAVFKLTKAMMLFTAPMFLVVVLWGGFGQTLGSALLGIGKYVALLVLVILLRNTNPRVKIKHAVRFFWGPVTALALIAVLLALVGV
ncbi:MAG: NADH-quinone oxidoreductase subunit H [Planctomycetes bacterium]|nr:NADH-quinone oxidoreductase subunit H [Planctomycetota bacterium]